MTTSVLYELNDSLVKLSLLRLEDDGEYISTANVTATVYDTNGTIIVSAVSMTHDSGSDGTYKGYIREGGSPGTPIEAGKDYQVKFDVYDPTNNLTAHWTAVITATERTYT